MSYALTHDYLCIS